MTDVKPYFIERWPLSNWVELACELHDKESLWLELSAAPQSPNPAKFMFVQERLADEVVKMCYQLRDFVLWRDKHQSGLSGLARMRKQAGMWPRFRLSQESQPPSKVLEESLGSGPST